MLRMARECPRRTTSSRRARSSANWVTGGYSCPVPQDGPRWTVLLVRLRADGRSDVGRAAPVVLGATEDRVPIGVRFLLVNVVQDFSRMTFGQATAKDL